MAILLRKHEHPGPVRRGLPAGHARQRDRRRADLQTDDAHAWVEVYFPGYRLVHVRPDRRRPRTRPSRCRSGKPVASAPPTPVPEPRSVTRRRSGRQRSLVARGRDAAGASGDGGGVGPGGFIADRGGPARRRSLLVAFLAWRRGPRGADDARERVYASIAGLARRFGFGPRPTADRLRVRDRARRHPARRPAGAADRRDRQGRGRLRPARARRRPAPGAPRLVPRGCGSGCSGWLFRRGDRAEARCEPADSARLARARPSGRAPPSSRLGPPRRGAGASARSGSSPGRRGRPAADLDRRRSRTGRTTTSRTARAAGRTGSAAGP